LDSNSIWRERESMSESQGTIEALLPADFAEWIPTTLLMQWVEEEIAQFDWDHPELKAFLASNPNYHPRELLRLVCYCYCRGIYRSAMISHADEKDPLLRTSEAPPSARVIAHFRRDNRALLKGCIAQVSKRLFKIHYELGDGLLPPGLKAYLVDDALARLTLARQSDLE
jgi:hypothetical protein